MVWRGDWEGATSSVGEKFGSWAHVQWNLSSHTHSFWKAVGEAICLKTKSYSCILSFVTREMLSSSLYRYHHERLVRLRTEVFSDNRHFFFPWTTWLTTELFEMGDAWELRFDCIWFPGLLQQSCCNKAAPTGRLETTIYSFTALETRSLKGSDVRCSTVPLQHLGQDSPLPLMASGGGWPSLVFLGSWQPDCELCFHFPIAFFTGLPGFFLLIRTLVIGFRVPPI